MISYKMVEVHLLLYLTFIGVTQAGSCYYEHKGPGYFYTKYEYCLNGCCGSYVVDGVNHCCDTTGVSAGIGLGVVAFVILLVVTCIICRRRRRRMLIIRGGGGERGRLVQQVTQYPIQSGIHNPYHPQTGTRSSQHMRTETRYNYQSGAGMQYPSSGTSYPQTTVPTAPNYKI